MLSGRGALWVLSGRGALWVLSGRGAVWVLNGTGPLVPTPTPNPQPPTPPPPTSCLPCSKGQRHPRKGIHEDGLLKRTKAEKDFNRHMYTDIHTHAHTGGHRQTYVQTDIHTDFHTLLPLPTLLQPTGSVTDSAVSFTYSDHSLLLISVLLTSSR